MNLFQLGAFTLHSGAKSRWKIEMDALTDGDWNALALMIAERAGRFQFVLGVPRGGLALARALRPHAWSGKSHPRLVVDDVLTTGASITALMQPGDIGFVVFARGPCPPNVRALFYMPEALVQTVESDPLAPIMRLVQRIIDEP